MATKRVSEKKVVMSASAAAPARRKSAVPTRSTRPTSVEVSGTPEVAPAASTSDAVARLAYTYWEARGYQGGSPEQDWLRAERELRAVTASN